MTAPDWFVRRWLHCGLRPRYLGIYAHRPNDARREQRPRRDHWEVYVVLAGQVTIGWYDHQHRAEAGQAYLTPPGTGWHDDLGRAEQDWRLFNCGFDFVESGWPNPLRDLGLPVVLPFGPVADCARRCQELVDQWQSCGSGLGEQVALRARVDAFLVTVLERGFAAGVFPAVEGSAPAWLLATRNALLRGVTDPDLDLSRLVASCGYCESHLAHAFKQHFHWSPMAYLRHERMDLAARLLRSHPEVAVRRIARRAGYRDANLFARHFRRHFGCSPSHWRSGEQAAGA